jgi:hypothetical protein
MRIGQFVVSRRLIGHADNYLEIVFRNLRILDVKDNWHTLEYTAIGPQFDEVPPGQTPALYWPLITMIDYKDLGVGYTIEWLKM